MGTITKQISIMKPRLDYILRTAERINTNKAQEQLQRAVNQAFEVLEPFRYDHKEICGATIKHSYYTSEYALCLGQCINAKSSYHKYGRRVEGHEFVDVIREFGRVLQPEVRNPIREDFLRLVELTEKVVLYKNVEVERNIQQADYQYSPSGRWSCTTKPTTLYNCLIEDEGALLKPLTVRRISLRTNDPKKIILSKKENGRTEDSIDIDEVYYLHMLEDILDDVVELYKEAERAVGQIHLHNEALLTQMRGVVSPWMIAKELK